MNEGRREAVNSQRFINVPGAGNKATKTITTYILRNQSLTVCVCVFYRWFCHVDDDNYVILPSLLRMLSSYHHSQDVYLGRPSLDHPIEAAERVKSDGSVSGLIVSFIISDSSH